MSEISKRKPKATNSLAEKEIDKAVDQFEHFDQQIKDMTLDRMNMAPKQAIDTQTKMSQKDIELAKEVYLKPNRMIGSREKFNEKYRADYEFSTEYVRFIAENKEIQGEEIQLWTKPFPGMPAQEWKVPTGKPLWGPRHLAERLTGCKYHRLVMNQTQSTGSDGNGQYFGAMAVDTSVQRLDAIPVSAKKSIFMTSSF